MMMASRVTGTKIQKVDAFQRNDWFAYIDLLQALLLACGAIEDDRSRSRQATLTTAQ